MTDAADADSEEMEQFQRRQDMMMCPGCGVVADARITFNTTESITNIHKRWVEVHHEHTEDGEDEFYFHFDESEVERGAELRKLLAADGDTEDVDHREERGHDRENLDEYTRAADRTGRGPRTDGGQSTHTHPDPPWIQLAEENVQKWGLQSPDALLLAMGEEMGELSREVLTWNEHADEGRRAEQGRDLIRRMADLGDDIQDYLETVSEDANGEPIPEDERPNYLTPCEDLNDSLAERRTTGELSDMMALGYQFLWALDSVGGHDE